MPPPNHTTTHPPVPAATYARENYAFPPELLPWLLRLALAEADVSQASYDTLLSENPQQEIPQAQARAQEPQTEHMLIPMEKRKAIRELLRKQESIVARTRAHYLAVLSKMDADAQDYIANAPHPARPQPATFAPEASIGERLSQLLDHAPGLIVGEAHSSGISHKFLIEQMPLLRAQGVDTMFIEGYPSEWFQHCLDRFSTSDQMPEALLRYVNDLDHGFHFQASGYSNLDLINCARRNNIRLVSLDTFMATLASSNLNVNNKSGFNADLRLRLMNYWATLTIQQHQRQSGAGKWVALVGALHVSSEQIPGLHILTGGIGIQTPDTPSLELASTTLSHLGPDFGNMHDGGALYPGKLCWVLSDMRLSTRPLPDGLEFNHMLEPQSFLLRKSPSASTLELRFRLAKADSRVKLILRQQGQYQVQHPEPEFPSLAGRRYTTVTDLARDIMDAGFTRQPLAMISPSDLAAWRQTISQRFQSTKDNILLWMAAFSSKEEQRAFKQGKIKFREELRGLGLEHAELTELQLCLAANVTRLSPQQQGALLQAVDQRRAQQLDLVAQQWQKEMESFGATRVARLMQNRYMAASERQLGVCSALSAQLSAAWMLDQTTTAADPMLNNYLEQFHLALTVPEAPSSSLYGQGLLQWSLNPDELKFGPHSANRGLSLSEIHEQLQRTQGPAAFELSCGDHAMALGVTQTADLRTYFLFDPNYGYATFASAASYLQGLQLMAEKLQARAANMGLPPDQALAFSLRQYCADLPQQPLFPASIDGWHAPSRLTLAELCNGQSLALQFNHGAPLQQNQFFRQLQQHLLVAEYRTKWQLGQQLGTPFTATLSHTVKRHHPEINLEQARLLGIQLKKLPLIELDYQLAGERKSLQIDSRLFGNEQRQQTIFFYRYKQFIDQVCARPEERSLLRRFQDWLRPPQVAIGTLFLSSALTDEDLSRSSTQQLRHLRRAS